MSRFIDELSKVWCDNILIVCIGISNVTGDSLGPLVGDILTKDKKFTVPVLGTTSFNIGASKIDSVRKFIEYRYRDYYVLCIDATVSDIYSVGTHVFRHTPLSPGKGLQKNLGVLGHGCIKGIVLHAEDLTNISNLKDQLYKVDKSFVNRLAQRISRDIKKVYFTYKSNLNSKVVKGGNI